MSTASIDYYLNCTEMFQSQTRRMSGPYIHHSTHPISHNMPRRYSVQTDGSHSQYLPPPTLPMQFQQHFQQQSMQKPPLRNVLSAPLAPNMPMTRKDSIKSTTDSLSGSTTELARYKTELCRPFEETGQCRYGAKCQFAHGMQELRTLNRHPKYKTELCRTFHTTGFCSYGQRCNFIHNEEEYRQMSNAASARRPSAPAISSTSTNHLPKIAPFNFPLSISNSTGDSPASSINGGSPSLSPCYLNDDVFPTARMSPTPSFGSDSGSHTSANFYTPPASPKSESLENAVSSLASPLDMGIDLQFFNNLVLE